METSRLTWAGFVFATASLAAVSLSVTVAGEPAHAREAAQHHRVAASASADAAWPGGADVGTADEEKVFGKNLSGLSFGGTGVLWAVKNSPSTLYRLVPAGTTWNPDPAGGWDSGKSLHYGNGEGDPDTEGVVATQDGLFAAVERDNDDEDVSQQEILRFDGSSSDDELDATGEWDLTADLPSSDPNSGIEGISWLPDSYLTAHGFRDERTGAAYDPGAYPNHGSGLYVVGLESNGAVYAYALDQSGGVTRVATISTGLPAVMDLEFEAGTGRLWAVCDDHCDGRAATLEVDAQGQLSVTGVYERPDGMPNLNNEGFAIAPECASDSRTVVWSDDDNDDDHALRAATLPCAEVKEGSSLPGADGGDGAADCTYPADVLNLTNWYEGLPTGEPEHPTNVKQPELATYSADPWFVATDDCAGVQFRAPVNGVTTSGSSYPRSELREMTDSGSSEASWSSTSGTHTMVVDEAITALPEEKPQVVAGQIHGSSDDISVFRLDGSNLYVTKDDDAHYKLVTSNYTLGTEFEAKFVVKDGKVQAYYNGTLQTTISWDFDGAYFKAGAYTQANCENSSPCSDDNYGQVVIHKLTVTHS